MDAHGETRPRKRANRKNKGGRQEEAEPEVVREKIILEEEDVGDDSWSDYHVEEDTPASLTYKILFFILLLLLGGLATVVLIDNNGLNGDNSSGVQELPESAPAVEESVGSSWLDWLTTEQPEDHHVVEEHTDEAREFIDHDHDEDDEHEGEHGDGHASDHREVQEDHGDSYDGDAVPNEEEDGDDDGQDGHDAEDDNNVQPGIVPQQAEAIKEPEPAIEEIVSYTTHEEVAQPYQADDEDDDDDDGTPPEPAEPDTAPEDQDDDNDDDQQVPNINEVKSDIPAEEDDAEDEDDDDGDDDNDFAPEGIQVDPQDIAQREKDGAPQGVNEFKEVGGEGRQEENDDFAPAPSELDDERDFDNDNFFDEDPNIDDADARQYL